MARVGVAERNPALYSPLSLRAAPDCLQAVVYRPVIHRRAGRVAAERFGLQPFLDGSCRREPDFESPTAFDSDRDVVEAVGTAILVTAV